MTKASRLRRFSAGLLVGAVGLLPLGQRVATAGPIDAKQAEAARIAAQLDAGAQRIADVASKLARAQSRLQGTDALLTRAGDSLRAADNRYGALRQRLSAQAVQAYVHGGSATLVDQLAHSAGGNDLALRNQYASMAAGQDRQTIDDLTAARQDLRDQRGALEALRRQQQSEVAALNAQKAALAKAEAGLQALLARVRGELAGLVAAERARRLADTRRRFAARPSSSPGGVWDCIRQLESGNNYSSPGGGAYQFLDSTWHAMGQSGTASDAPPATQDQMAMQLQQQAGWDQWTTARRCGVG